MCLITADGAENATITCDARAACQVRSTKASNVKLRCVAGSSCSIRCRDTSNCEIDCQGGACLMDCSAGGHCTRYGCGGAPYQSCGGGVWACGRPCP
jgi:hypothetical protein